MNKSFDDKIKILQQQIPIGHRNALAILKKTDRNRLHNRITKAEDTVVQKLNQGTTPKTGCNRFRMPFFGSFLGKQKRTIQSVP